VIVSGFCEKDGGEGGIDQKLMANGVLVNITSSLMRGCRLLWWPVSLDEVEKVSGRQDLLEEKRISRSAEVQAPVVTDSWACDHGKTSFWMIRKTNVGEGNGGELSTSTYQCRIKKNGAWFY